MKGVASDVGMLAIAASAMRGIATLEMFLFMALIEGAEMVGKYPEKFDGERQLMLTFIKSQILFP